MTGSGFALLLGFALLKIALGLTVIYLGLRGGGRGEPDEPVGVLTQSPPPPLPSRLPAPRPRRPVRGGPRGPRRAPGRARV